MLHCPPFWGRSLAPPQSQAQHRTNLICCQHQN
nr:MAG TPA: hypothetical protein [Caudoviricetes sp.]